MNSVYSYINRLIVSLVRIALFVEPWLASFMMLMSTSAFLDLYEDAGYGWTGRARYYMWKLLVLIALGFIGVRWKKVLNQLPTGKYLLAFIGIVWLSQYWSIDVYQTKSSTLLLIESTIIGIYIASRYNFQEQTRLLMIMFSIASLLSIFYVYAMPNLGIMNGPKVSEDLQGTWRGIYVHKNVMGRVMTVGGILLLIQPFIVKKRKWLAWLIFLVCLQLILGTNSKTGLVGFLFIIAISPIARVFRWSMAVGIPLYICAMLLGGVGAVFLGDNWDAALNSIGKDPNLNGRLPIWQILVHRIGERPWLGYGFHAFWQGWSGKYSGPIWRQIVWLPGHAHNGFMDLMIDVGFVGAFMFALAFFDAIFKSINRIRYTPDVSGLWPLGFMTFYVIMNQTQTALISPHNIQWLLFILICFTPVYSPQIEENSIEKLTRAPRTTKSVDVSNFRKKF
ncbi:MAG: O-antigen ligase family protein [candidate division WOR-3 bacterium]